jgi:hypothetical protein
VGNHYQQPHVPSADDKIVWAENNGALMLIFPTAVKTGVPTQHGECDMVQAKIVRLEDGRVWENGAIFPTALVNQTRAAAPDGMVLGRLGQGQNTKGNAPWILQPHTAEDVARADAWIAANPVNQYQNAAPAQQWGGQQGPPASAPASAWGAPATPASPAPGTGGWGAPAPAQQVPNVAAAGWGAPAPAAPSAPAAPAQSQFDGQWGGAAPTPPPVAAAPVTPVDPGLAEALRRKGQTLPPGTSHESALGIWALVQNQPDVTA